MEEAEIPQDSDLARFIELYRSFGIECVINKQGAVVGDEGQKGFWIYFMSNGPGFLDQEQSTSSDKFDGYSGFYSSVEFDEAGSFIKQGFWE